MSSQGNQGAAAKLAKNNLSGLKDLEKMLAEPFEDFTFSPAGASVYHLGNYGTARAQLKALDLKP